MGFFIMHTNPYLSRHFSIWRDAEQLIRLTVAKTGQCLAKNCKETAPAGATFLIRRDFMIKPLYIACLLLVTAHVNAQTIVEYIAGNTPDSRYTVHDNGRVTDTKTGLIWQRCSLGQIWEQDSCTGDTSKYNWQQALQQADKNNFAGYSDWRLPNVEELRSIVAYDRYDPAINSSIFPNTLSSRYWSSSPYAGGSINAWVVYFNLGYDDAYDRGRNPGYAVRLVRSGE